MPYLRFRTWVLLLLGALLMGCTGASYGRYSNADEITVRELEQQAGNFDTSFLGMTVGTAAAVIFDPKGDDRVLVGDRLVSLADRRRLTIAVDAVESYIEWQPRLYRILGPQGDFYGYIFFALGQPVFRVVDAKTLYVVDMRSPVYIGGGGGLGSGIVLGP